MFPPLVDNVKLVAFRIVMVQKVTGRIQKLWTQKTAWLNTSNSTWEAPVGLAIRIVSDDSTCAAYSHGAPGTGARKHLVPTNKATPSRRALLPYLAFVLGATS